MVINKIALVLSVVAILVTVGSVILSSVSIQTRIFSDYSSTDSNLDGNIRKITNVTETNMVSIVLPAVDQEGNGVATRLTVEVIPGKGRVLTNINNLLFWVDVQQSIQTAEQVAAKISKVNLDNIDIIYTIETEATVIEGPSAGAALTVATIAAMGGRQLNSSVMISGTIGPDGSIGPVGGIVAKAAVAKEVGATLFLVPEGQGLQTTYIPKQTCRETGSFTFCVTEYVKQTIDAKKELGIDVIEVSSISEAVGYMLV